MKLLILSAFLVLAAANTYSPDNDNIDIESVVSNVDVLRDFINCFNDNTPCDEVKSDFKKDLPEVFETSCSKCTDKQKHIFKRFIDEAKVKLPSEYGIFLQKYDTQGKFIQPLQAAISGF
ncbi:putative odorant-binding protein A10 [Pieris brassicae]|uniref:putative odorant-binding protein A10 n=1 Tax=Pieris brassicae TaxID=7116 RepID=UPI001E65F757|nr:putative odorant-binding protein A10 [Pieris brassicae]